MQQNNKKKIDLKYVVIAQKVEGILNYLVSYGVGSFLNVPYVGVLSVSMPQRYFSATPNVNWTNGST